MIFLVVVTVVCVCVVIYPYLIYPVILKMTKEKKIHKCDEYHASVTLVFCAYNEEKHIRDKIQNVEMLKSKYPNIEVLAYDDGSTDSTLDLLSSRSDLLSVVQGEGRKGKAHGMKTLVSMAKGEIIVFTDANVMLREDAIQNLLSWYGDPSVGGVCGSLKYCDGNESSTAIVGSMYWRLEEYLKSEESRTGNVMGADGSIFSIRKNLYPEFPDFVLDDLTVSMAVVFNKSRLIKVDDVIAYENLVSAAKKNIPERYG